MKFKVGDLVLDYWETGTIFRVEKVNKKDKTLICRYIQLIDSDVIDDSHIVLASGINRERDNMSIVSTFMELEMTDVVTLNPTLAAKVFDADLEALLR